MACQFPAWCPGPVASPRRRCNACEAEFRRAAAPAPVVAAAAPIPPALALVRGVATPREVLATRGSTGTTVHLGVGEQVDLTLSAPPPAGTALKWSIQGDAEITNQTATTALLTAGPTAGTVTVTLKVDGGPHNGHKLSTLEFKVIAPSGTTTRQNPDEPLLRHLHGHAGVGFKMWINLLPNTVIFSRVQWREHTGLGLATGHFQGENGRIHAPSGVAYALNGGLLQPVNTLSATWMNVFGDPGAPYGVNWVGQIDTVDTGDHAPEVAAVGAVPARWKASSHHWNIEWKYRVQKANGTWSGEYLLERAMHEATIAVNGTATIKKAGCGPFSRLASAGNSGYV